MNAIFPGKFDPIHNGHVAIINQALKEFDNIYVVIMENPEIEAEFSVEQRLEWLKSIESDRVIIDYHKGLASEYFAKANTKVILRGYRNKEDHAYEIEKERRYKKQDADVVFKLYKTDSSLCATDIRKFIKANKDIKQYVPF